MPDRLNDIEEFTTDRLRAEILRRETAAREHRCWYCGLHLDAHTCKHALKESPAPGWEVSPPRYVRGEDCMGRDEEYWQVDARHPILGLCRTGTGRTSDWATKACLERIREQESEWIQVEKP